jgi:competence protein ComEC
MKALQFPLIKITFWFVLGILFSYVFNLKIEIAIPLLIVLLLLFSLCYWLAKQRKISDLVFGLVLYSLVFTIGITSFTINKIENNPNNYIRHVSTSTSTNHYLSLVLNEKLNSTPKFQRYIAEVKTIDNFSTSGKIIVNFHSKNIYTSLNVGNKIFVKNEIKIPKKPKNPNQFDYGKYLAHKSIGAQLFIYNKDYVVSPIIEKSIWYYTYQLRKKILDNLRQSGFKLEELNTVAALILGQRQDLSSDIIQDYQLSGAIHILSVSGLHVGYLFLTLSFLLSLFPKNKFYTIAKLVLMLTVLWGFAILAGFSPSVIRSATMFSVIAIGQYLKRQTNIYNTLCIALFVILLIEPNFLFDIGFQLSFVAVFFIVWLYPQIKKLWNPKYKIINYLWEIFAVSLAAQLGTLPISLYYFHQFPGLFFITNIVVLPFLGFIMILGVLVMFLAAFNIVPFYLFKILEWSITALNTFIHWIATYDSFIIRDIPFEKFMLISAFGMIITFGLWLEKNTLNRFKHVLLSVLIFQITYFSVVIYNTKKEFLVFNIKNSTVIGNRNGNKLELYTNNSVLNDKTLKPYLIGNFNPNTRINKLKNFYFFDKKRIEVIDKSGAFSPFLKPDILIIINSPKINFERIINQIQPKLIVADASNYKFLVEKWESTCYKEKIPFYDTSKKGFYQLNFK